MSTERDEQMAALARGMVEYFVNAEHVQMKDGLLLLEAKEFAPAGFLEDVLDEDLTWDMRDNVATKLMDFIAQNVYFQSTYDDITATRAFRDMPREAAATVIWQYFFIAGAFIKSEVFAKGYGALVRATYFSCLVYDDSSYVTHYKTETKGVWAKRELDAVMESIKNGRLKPPREHYRDFLGIMKQFREEPGPCGDLVRMMIGEGGGGWATDR